MFQSSKGQATLAIILLVVVGFFVAMVIFRAVVVTRGVEVRNVMELQIDVIDKGGMLAELLSSGDIGMNRMEKLGALFYPEMAAEETGIRDIISRTGNQILLLDSKGSMVNSMGDEIKADKMFDAEIPLPGGAAAPQGSIKGTVRMVE